MRRLITRAFALLAFALLPLAAAAQTSVQQAASRLDATTLVAVGTNFATVNAQAVATVSVPAGQYAYITKIDLWTCGDATGTAATNNLWTSTGIAGAPSWTFSATTGTSLSTCQNWGESFSVPLKSAQAGVNVVITSPSALLHTAFPIKIYYYLAP